MMRVCDEFWVWHYHGLYYRKMVVSMINWIKRLLGLNTQHGSYMLNGFIFEDNGQTKPDMDYARAKRYVDAKNEAKFWCAVLDCQSKINDFMPDADERN